MVSPTTMAAVRASGAVPNAEYLLAVEGVRKEFPGVVALDDVSVPAEARHRACADGRERRRQVDADEDPRRHLHARHAARCSLQGRDIRLEIAARCARKRHRHDPSGAQPDAVHDGGREHLDPPRAENRFGFVDHGKMHRHDGGAVQAAEHRHSIRESQVRDLSIANRQMVEIAKAVSYESDVLIMDEPTSALTEREVAHLFEIIRDLRAPGQRHRLHHPQDERAVRDRRRVLGVPRRQVHRHACLRARSRATTSSA